MPTVIYRRVPDKDKKNEKIAYLCDDCWGLAVQIDALEHWLNEFGSSLPVGDYVADVGIVGRTDFEHGFGGGAAFPPEAMRIMSEKGMWLFLSEYPEPEDE